MLESGHDHHSLLTQLAKGDETAFRRLFSLYSGRIHSTALAYLKSPSLAEEVVQDVFMKVWMKKETLAQLNSFEAWLHTVTKNHLLNSLDKLAGERKTKSRLANSQPAYEEQSESLVQLHQYENLLQKALGSLSPMQKDVYRLVREEELSYEQTGRQLGISALTVKTHMSRALRHIRHFFHQNGELFTIFFL